MAKPIYVIVESSTQIQLEMHRELESAKQAANEINARWGNNEVFIKKIKEGCDAGKVLTNRHRGLQKNRCWKGYKPVKGKRPYSKGSCRKVSRKLKRNMSRIPTQQEYEMREARLFKDQMREVEMLPLAERQENAREWFKDLMDDQKLIAERVGWLLNGSYGKGSFDSACRVLASPRMNQVAWCAITIASLEWRCPAKMAIASWKKLPVETRYIVNEAIRREIADAKAEGYCG